MGLFKIINKVIKVSYRLDLPVTDLINQIVQVLKEDLYWFRISAQEIKLLKPTELGNKG